MPDIDPILAVQNIRALHVRREQPVYHETECAEGDCDHEPGTCIIVTPSVCAHCADQTEPDGAWEHTVREAAYWPCATIRALGANSGNEAATDRQILMQVREDLRSLNPRVPSEGAGLLVRAMRGLNEALEQHERLSGERPQHQPHEHDGSGCIDCDCPNGRYDLHVEGGCSWTNGTAATRADTASEALDRVRALADRWAVMAGQAMDADTREWLTAASSSLRAALGGDSDHNHGRQG